MEALPKMQYNRYNHVKFVLKMMGKNQNGKLTLCLILTAFGVFMMFMALKDSLYPRHIIVDTLPELSGFHVNKNWDIAKDPWVKDAVIRSHIGIRVTRLSPFVPIAIWGKDAYMRQDGKIIKTTRKINKNLPVIHADRMYAKEIYPLVEKVAQIDSAARFNVSQVGTLSVTISQGRSFVFGRSHWLKQWQKMQSVLKKFPQHKHMHYDMRYADGVTMRSVEQNT